MSRGCQVILSDNQKKCSAPPATPAHAGAPAWGCSRLAMLTPLPNTEEHLFKKLIYVTANAHAGSSSALDNRSCRLAQRADLRQHCADLCRDTRSVWLG